LHVIGSNPPVGRNLERPLKVVYIPPPKKRGRSPIAHKDVVGFDADAN
jgi:hypothetical protein